MEWWVVMGPCGHNAAEELLRYCGLARFTLAFLSAQGEDSAHFIGSSLGGRITLECAHLAPARVRSMVLAAPAGIGRETALTMRHASVPVLGELLARPSRIGTRMLWAPAFHDPSFVTNGLVETKYALARAPCAHQAVLKTLRNLVSVDGFRMEKVAALQAVMRTLQQPTLIIWGQQDRLVPPDHARILEAKLPRSRTILFDECGHLPQLEQPQKFNEAVLDFLALLWQIYSRCVLAQICFWQCGHRCGGGRPMSAAMA
jgi:pimeloyl-ACP methyl ester carboxylesterase